MDLSHPVRGVERQDEDEGSSVSDYDSEWTQVTEDDSDFPPLSGESDRPLSRADTAEDSLNGDLWEGITDGDDSRTDDVQSLDDSEHENATHIAAEASSAHSLSASVATHRSDEEIENDALNSSVMGTLTASRSRSVASSLHASLTESQSRLRLSFPDPLTSRDNLDTIATASDAEPSPIDTSAVLCDSPEVIKSSSSFETVESPSLMVPSAAARIEVDHVGDINEKEIVLDIVLYGSTSPKKWAIACDMMRLALDCDDRPLLVKDDDGPACYYHLCASDRSPIAGAFDTQSLFVRVLDRTASCSGKSYKGLNVPSLAIILLPSTLPSELPNHTFYLPLINPPSMDFSSSASMPRSLSTFSEQIVADSAYYAWNRLEIRSNRVIHIDDERLDEIHDVSVIDRISRETMVRALRPVFEQDISSNLAGSKEKNADECASLFTNRWHLILFVIATTLAISVGRFQLHNATLNRSWDSLNSTESVLPLRATSPSVATIPHSAAVTSGSTPESISRSSYELLATRIARSMAPTNFSPLAQCSNALAKTTPIVGGIIRESESSGLPQSESKIPSTLSSSRTKLWAKKLNLGLYNPTDMIVRPAAVVDVVNKPSSLLPYRRPQKATEKTILSTSEEVKAVGLRAVHTSLALISDVGKALMQDASKEILVLYEAIDELLRAIKRQIDGAKADTMRSRSLNTVLSRNARAKHNARLLRRMGEKMFKAASERLNVGKSEAVKVAHQIRDGTRTVGKDDARRLQQMGQSFLRSAGERFHAGTVEAVKAARQLRDGSQSVREEAAKSRGARRQRRQERKTSKSESASDNPSVDVKAGTKDEDGSRKQQSNRGTKKHRKRMLHGQPLGGKEQVRRDGDDSKGVLEALMDAIH